MVLACGDHKGRRTGHSWDGGWLGGEVQPVTGDVRLGSEVLMSLHGVDTLHVCKVVSVMGARLSQKKGAWDGIMVEAEQTGTAERMAVGPARQWKAGSGGRRQGTHQAG